MVSSDLIYGCMEGIGDRMRKTGENSRVSSQHNRGLILKLIATGQCHSRIELARETQLTKMTITNIVSEFRRNHILEEAEERPNDVRGRNPITVKIAPEAPKAVGLLMGEGVCEAVLCDFNAQIQRRETLTLPAEAAELPGCLAGVISRMREQEENLCGIGIAADGAEKYRETAEKLREWCGLPVFVNPPSSGAALAESLYGAGRQVRDFVYVGIGERISGGIVMDGELQKSRNGMAAEVGHVCIERHGRGCACGNSGCLEAYAGVDRIIDALCEATGKQMSFQAYCEEMPEGADPVLHEMMENLAAALVSVINLIHPETVILGDEAVYLPQKYLDDLELMINRCKLGAETDVVSVKKSEFLQDARAVGAACSVIAEIFKGTLACPERI